MGGYYEKSRRNKKDFFLSDLNELGNRIINSDVRQLELEMKQQYNNQHHKVKTNKKSNIIPKTGMTVISRSDVPKITVKNRTDIIDGNKKIIRFIKLMI